MKIMGFCSGAMFFVALVLNVGVMTSTLSARAAQWTGPVILVACLLFLETIALAMVRRRRNE